MNDGERKSQRPNDGSRCPLCGVQSVILQEGCGPCLLQNSCELICCSNCGYRSVARSRLVGWIQRVAERVFPGAEAAKEGKRE